MMRSISIAAISLLVFTASRGMAVCGGDCNGDRAVTVGALLSMVNIALGNAAVSTCAAGVANGDQQITIDEVLTAVTNALTGCRSLVPTRPPVPAGCTKSGGYTRIVFSEASGTNSLVGFDQPLDLFGVTGSILATTRGVGGASKTCPTTLTAPIVTLDFNVGGFPQELAVGNTYPLHDGPVIELPLIKIAQVDYAEVLATDPFNRHAWRSESGSLTVDSINGDTVTLLIDARMVAQPSPATGTFRMQVYTIVDKVLRP